nr:uncharacterized protein LOC127291711 [Lolium perenne]
MDASQDFVQLKDKNSAIKLKLGELEGAYQISLKEQSAEDEKGFQVCREAALKEKEQDVKEMKKLRATLEIKDNEIFEQRGVIKASFDEHDTVDDLILKLAGHQDDTSKNDPDSHLVRIHQVAELFRGFLDSMRFVNNMLFPSSASGNEAAETLEKLKNAPHRHKALEEVLSQRPHNYCLDNGEGASSKHLLVGCDRCNSPS